MSLPIIGMILDSEAAGGYSKLPWYALRENYVRALADQGAVPFLLPHELALADAYLERIDGLLIPGGDFDIDPEHFGVSTRHETVVTKDQRTAFELLMTREAHRRDLPLLGICGGQHIPDEVENALAHEQPNPRNEPGHEVMVDEGTLLHRITGARRLSVNSAHHQAVREVSGGVIVNARAPDGVIEGIEDPDRRFCLGVQWHPEYLVSEGDSKIFTAFVAAAAER